MNDDEFKQLEERYFLVRRHRIWYLIGGVIGTIAAMGVISYKAAISVLDSTTAAAVLRDIQSRRDTAEQIVKDIEMEAAKLKTSEAEFNRLTDARIAIYDQRAKLQDERERLAPAANALIFNQPSQAPEAKNARARIKQINAEIAKLEQQLGFPTPTPKK
jgi:septal ring factor EnvC (AmiA/AmiB activator)